MIVKRDRQTFEPKRNNQANDKSSVIEDSLQLQLRVRCPYYCMVEWSKN